MENNTQVRNIMHEFIQSGNSTVKDCFKQICVTLNLQKEYNILVCLEKILENNSEITECYARHLYDKASDLCEQNAKLYSAIKQEAQAIDNNANTQSGTSSANTGQAGMGNSSTGIASHQMGIQ